MKTKLSVNINKIATLRNARGGNTPNVVEAAINCEKFGAQGITVHPRPDQRHITYQDVFDLKKVVKTEFNIEGNPIPEFKELVLKVKPDQVTLVPDAEDAITSNAGWDTEKHFDFCKKPLQSSKQQALEPLFSWIRVQSSSLRQQKQEPIALSYTPKLMPQTMPIKMKEQQKCTKQPPFLPKKQA